MRCRRACLPYLVILLAIAFLFPTLARAEDQSLPPADRIKIIQGNNEAGVKGDTIKIIVEVLGPVRRGWLGGEGGRSPVKGATVTFSVLNKRIGDIEITSPREVTTDAGGYASCEVRIGGAFGDHYVEARTTGHDGKPRRAEIRIIAGVRISGSGQEGPAGTVLPDPLALQVIDETAQPAPEIPVFWSVNGNTKDASLTEEQTRTDEDGVASTHLTLPVKTQKIYVTAEIADPHGKYVARGIRFEAVAVNSTVMVISLIGGLAIFIFGMKQMSEGLQRVAGDKLRLILRMFTRNRFVAIAVGALVTALIQSSSATTVMTVGFVNAGLITLRHAIGVVLGANIGTTVTGQIIAFRLDALAYPAIAAGLLIMMVAKNRTHRHWGQAIMGFGLLFLGMQIMHATLGPIRDVPSFVNFFRGFSCKPGPSGVMPIAPVIYSLFIGTLLTVVIQSSSATIGLTIALATSGLIDFYTAVPIVLGDNIGTTITALLASIGTNRAARRTALAHSLFNVIGAAYMVTLFYIPAPWSGRPIFLEIINSTTAGNVFADEAENIARHVAMAHSVFNVFNVIIFIPLVAFLERLVNAILPRLKEEEERITYLEPRLLNQPSIALEQAVKELGYMANQSFDSIKESFTTLDHYDVKVEEKINKREDTIDRLQAEITNYLVQLSQHELDEAQSKTLGPLMHAVNDVERIGDHAENILELAMIRENKKFIFSDLAKEEMTRMINTVLEPGKRRQGAQARRDHQRAGSHPARQPRSAAGDRRLRDASRCGVSRPRSQS